MPKSKEKREQLEAQIQKVSNELLRSGFNNQNFQFVSMTRVELNGDFSEVKLFWDTFDASSKDSIHKALIGARGRFRSLLAKELKIRHTPTITFMYDSQFEDENHINQILQAERA